MMFPLARRVLLGLFVLAAPTAAQAHPGHDDDHADGAIVISRAWARQTPPEATVGAAYLMIWNRSHQDDALTAATSPQAERVELHRTERDGNRMSMVKMEAIDLPADQAVVLEPGGRHLMFKGLKGAFNPGDTVDVTLTFRRADPVTLQMPVKEIGYKPQSGGMMQPGGKSGR